MANEEKEEKRANQEELEREQREERERIQGYEQEDRDYYIQDAKTWRDEAQTWYDNRQDELELYNFKLDLKKSLLESATDDEIKEQYQQEFDDVKDQIRRIQVDIGYDKRNLQSNQNHLDRLIMENDAIKANLEFESGKSDLLALEAEKDALYSTAKDGKAALESQLVVLNDLLYSVDDEVIIEEINAKIAEFSGQI